MAIKACYIDGALEIWENFCGMVLGTR